MFVTWNRFVSILLVLGALVFVGGARTNAAAAPAKELKETKIAVPVPFPDGVIDPELRTAFVTSPKGGIQAIRLEDGKVLWTNDACTASPWLVAGDRLIARGERIFVLDTKNGGKLLRQCDAPAYPKVKIPERCTVSFHLWGPRVSGDTLQAHWFGVANIDRSKGRPFPFQAWTAFNKAAPAGTVKINLDTGRVELHTDQKPSDVAAGLIPEAAKPDRQMPAGLPEKLAALWQQYHKDQNGRITILGKRLVGVSMTLERQGNEFQKKIDLNAWDVKTGAAEKPVELIKDKAISIANIVLTEDRRHAGVQFGNSAVAIFSLATGKRIGTDVKGFISPERAFVEGKRLYVAKQGGGPQATHDLVAIDLKSGKVQWERALQPRKRIILPP
jgi:hypothetical protein